MPRIRCRYMDCIFLDDGYCGAMAVEFDPDEGCLTFTRIDDVATGEDWDEEDLDELFEQEFFDEEDEELDDWLEAEE